ncbi:hypothetical protein, partial [Phascolarctobacterium succinatutens]|uniref:hypothetical protein n=1 Tax=Phascolarctobacterium succinatutens TaxID=626940 RepID=UPI0026F167E5
DRVTKSALVAQIFALLNNSRNIILFLAKISPSAFNLIESVRICFACVYQLFQIKISAYFQQLTISARYFCNMLHFSLLDLPFSSQHSPSTPFLQEISATCCTFLF